MEKYFISLLNYDKSPKEARALHSREIHFSGNILKFAPFFFPLPFLLQPLHLNICFK